MTIPPHISWIIDTGQKIKTINNKDVSILELQHIKDEAILSAWATHFRNHYCLDSQIDVLRDGTGKSRADYLRNIKIPDHLNKPGPSVRSGDFAEILVADYLEFVLNFWVPDKHKYSRKFNRNESIKGCDIVGFYLSDDKNSLNDILSIYEVKACYSSGTTAKDRLQIAVNDSSKDNIRKAETLNAIKQKFIEKNDVNSVKKVQRFQNINDNPFSEIYGAVAVLDNALYDDNIISQTDTSKHSNHTSLSLLVIKINEMKSLIADLYERAANEA